jgi:hypothetical protein
MSLTEFRQALTNTDQVEITATGRKSGKHLTNPVWFVQEAEKLSLVPVNGSDSDRYKNVRRTPVIEVSAQGKSITAHPTPITDAGRVGDIVDQVRQKYGEQQVKAYFKKLDVAADVPLSNQSCVGVQT